MAMMIELDALMGSNLVTTVFLYGSAAMFVVSAAVATWLCERDNPSLVLRPQTAKAVL
jgi:hypothetical protein